MPVLLAHAIEDSTDIFGISGGLNTPNPPSVRHCLKPGYCLEIGYHCHPAVNRVSSRNIRDNLIQCCVALEVEKVLISC